MTDLHFRVLRVNFSISFWFGALISLYTLVFDNSLRVLLAVLLHECGHGLAIYLCGSGVQMVSLKLTDIRMESDLSGLNRKKRVLIAAAGPLANLFGCLSSLIFGDEVFLAVNLVIGLFQLLPAADSDGGEILCLLFNERISRLIYFLTAFAVFTAGIMLLFHNRNNFSLLIAGLYIIFMSCK